MPDRLSAGPEPGLISATMMKLFAAVCMTADHLGAYGAHIPFIGEHAYTLRLLGRIAAPVFLYLVVESARHTRRRRRFILRLYIAAVCVGLCNVCVNAALFDSSVTFGNILHSFVWVAGIIYLAEYAADQYRQRRRRRAVLCVLAAALFICAAFALERILPDHRSTDSIPDDLLGSLLRSPQSAEYSVLFIALGVAWYFLKTKFQRCAVLLCLCAVSLFPGVPDSRCFILVSPSQWAMLGAIPLILLYNGQYGRGGKTFFYLYYPLHCYLIAIINHVFQS